MLNRPRVVLYNPRAVFFTMPLALIAIASALDRDSIDVVIVDGRLEKDPIAAVVAASRGAVCVGVTVLTGAPIHDALAVSRAIKSTYPSMPIVWGGWHPSLFASECSTNPAVDIVAADGRRHVRNIVDRLMAGFVWPESIGGAESLTRFLHTTRVVPSSGFFAPQGSRQI